MTSSLLELSSLVMANFYSDATVCWRITFPQSTYSYSPVNSYHYLDSPLFGLTFTILGSVYVMAVKNVGLATRIVNLIGRMSDTMLLLVESLDVDSLQSDEEKSRKRNRAKADLDALRRELKESSELRI
jgi:sensor histidine kinase YesM